MGANKYLFMSFRLNVAICNDLFSRFEQQILFLEKQVEATDPTTDLNGTTDHRRVSFQNT